MVINHTMHRITMPILSLILFLRFHSTKTKLKNKGIYFSHRHFRSIHSFYIDETHNVSPTFDVYSSTTHNVPYDPTLAECGLGTSKTTLWPRNLAVGCF